MKKRAYKRVAYEDNGVRVMTGDTSAMITVDTHGQMSIDEARAFIAVLHRAIKAACFEVEKGFLF